MHSRVYKSTLLFVAATYALQLTQRAPSARARVRSALRVQLGREDTEGKYPYVISLILAKIRVCTGTLVAPRWVLTAAHCHSSPLMEIQYGNMSLFPSESTTIRNIIRFIRHDRYSYEPYLARLQHDIALARVEEVLMSAYGKISSLDCMTLTGYPVESAGYGLTNMTSFEEIFLYNNRPLQLGQGIVTRCSTTHPVPNQGVNYGPFVCMSPRCDNREQTVQPGDSGGPLVYDGQVVGVASHISRKGVMKQAYTPVSPYLEWIQHTITHYVE